MSSIIILTHCNCSTAIVVWTLCDVCLSQSIVVTLAPLFVNRLTSFLHLLGASLLNMIEYSNGVAVLLRHLFVIANLTSVHKFFCNASYKRFIF